MKNLQGIIIENRIIRDKEPLSRDLARHLQDRYAYGKAAVAANNPVTLLSSVRKQWLRLIRLAERERASTLNRGRKFELDQAIWRMRSVKLPSL